MKYKGINASSRHNNVILWAEYIHVDNDELSLNEVTSLWVAKMRNGYPKGSPLITSCGSLENLHACWIYHTPSLVITTVVAIRYTPIPRAIANKIARWMRSCRLINEFTVLLSDIIIPVHIETSSPIDAELILFLITFQRLRLSLEEDKKTRMHASATAPGTMKILFH